MRTTEVELIETTTKQPKLYYGWVIVIALMAMSGAATGFLFNTLSVFVRPVSEALGVSRTTFALYGTYGSLASMLMAPVWGEFFKNRRFKPYMLVACALLCAATYAFSFATQVRHFYAIALVHSGVLGMLTGVPVARILTNWFVEKRGLATGITLAGSGLAGSLMTPLLSRAVYAQGWQAGYRLLALSFIVVAAPVTLFVIKEHPQEMGLQPLGYKPPESRPDAPESPDANKTQLRSGISRAQALRSKTFWCFALGLFLVQGCCMGTVNNVINHMADIGFDPAFAARIYALLMLMLVPGKPLLGIMYDRLTLKMGTVVILLMTAVCPLILAAIGLFTQVGWLPYFFAGWGGIALSVVSMQLPYMTPRLMGEKEFSRVFGICQPFTQLGAALLVPMANRGQELLGSYIPVFATASVGLLAALALMLTAIRLAPIETEAFDRADGIVPAPVAEIELAQTA